MTVRRLKTYAAQTGYVYQYYFVGQRAALPDAPEGPATEYIFDVTPDRKITYAVSIFLGEGALAAWQQRHRRPLTAPEQYAAAKLRLFEGLDEIADLAADPRRLLIDGEGLESLLDSLQLD